MSAARRSRNRNGFLVPLMDLATYATRVEALLGDKTQAGQMGEIGRLLVSEHYGFSRYITGLEDLFARSSPTREAE